MQKIEKTDLKDYIVYAAKQSASDLHITVGQMPLIRVNSDLKSIPNTEKITPKLAKQMAVEITPEKKQHLLKNKEELDFSFSINGVGRFRVNVYKQRGTFSIAIRALPFEIPDFSTLGLPNSISDFTEMKKGLILITGVTGSGKSTTLASLIDIINKNKKMHIITIEDPIEYLHNHKKSFITQREVGEDTVSFKAALRASLREDPDVILVGEMRDLETIEIALTAAETGHLVFSTMHTMGASKTIDRIIDVFPSNQQNQISTQLATSLKAVISQQLIPDKNMDRRHLATEIMISNTAIRNMIREKKPYQIDSIIQNNKDAGMHTMEKSIVDLYMSGKITKNEAYTRAPDIDVLKKYLSGGNY